MNKRGRSDYSSSYLTIPPAIVPRAMTVRLTDAAMHGPIGRAAIPGATAVIVIIVPVVVRTADANMNARRVEVEALRPDRGGRSNCTLSRRARHAFATLRHDIRASGLSLP